MLANLSPEQRMVDQMKRRLGAPYIWGGKGYVKWSPTGLVVMPEDGQGSGHPLYGVDCSGLITAAMKDAGGPDWRMSHNAQYLLNECEREQPPNEFGSLHFYGKSRSAITHVKFSLGNGLFLEACGGDETTTTPKPGACVMLNWENRLDFQEAGRLPLAQLLK